jgi:protocatechuate 3,4-dioxygenase beta subunit
MRAAAGAERLASDRLDVNFSVKSETKVARNPSLWTKRMLYLRPLLFALLMCASVALAQTDPITGKTAVKATISGIVTDAATGQPLKKAQLMLRNTQPGNGRFQRPEVVTTGVDGRYAFTVDPGQYRLAANRNGYVQQAYGQKDARRPGTILTLTEGQELKSIDFRLVPGGVITGRVVDEDGEPMSNVNVQLLRATYFEGERRLEPAGGNARSDDRGEFRIFGLAPRRYYVSAMRRGGFEMGPMMLTVGEDGQPLTRGSNAEGYATTYYPGTTDMTSAAPLEVRAGEEQRVNFTLVPTRVVKVSGRVIGADGQPVKQGFTNLVSHTGGFGQGNFAPVQNGRFEIHGVVPGSYSLVAGSRDEDPEGGQRDVEVVDNDISDLVLNLTNGRDIRGTIKFVDFSGKQPEVNVSLIPKRSVMFFGAASASVKEDSSFTLKDVFAQDYQTIVSGIPPDAFLKSVRVGDAETLITGFNGAKAGNMQIIVSGRAAVIQGTVTDRAGNPFPGATIVLNSTRPLPRMRGSSSTPTVSADQNGHFIFRGLAPGDYKLSAWEEIEEEEYSAPEFATRSGGLLTSVKVSEGDAVTADLKLISSEQKLQASQ